MTTSGKHNGFTLAPNKLNLWLDIKLNSNCQFT